MLEVKKISKRFGGVIAVNELDFTVSRGEIIGLIGPNGAGKTTVFNLITGFLSPTNGDVIFEGKKITGEKPHVIAKSGLVRTFQLSNIFSDFTVIENLVAASYLHSGFNFVQSLLHTRNNHRKEDKVSARVAELLKFTGLESLKDTSANALPHGYKRILGIAISIAAEPKLLLLDEPFSGMNTGEVDVSVALIKKIWERGITVLLIEHNVRAVMNLCQKIVVLEMGKKIAEGTRQEILSNPQVIDAYLGGGKDAT